MTLIRKLPATSAVIVMPLVLSVIMTLVVSLISTVRVLGLQGEALRAWPAAWALSWLIAFPTLLLVLPIVRRVVSAIVMSPTR